MNVYTIQKSKVKHKKYTAILKDGKKVHFGDNRYEQYKDSTPLKAYKHKDHNDEKRKQNYYARHGKEAKVYSAKWFSHKYLW